MIKYLKSNSEKNSYKESIKRLFLKEYNKELNDKDWDFINGYSDQSVMIVYLINDDVVGMANLIHNYYILNKSCFEYFIYTTSIVSKDFRTKGIYTVIMIEIRKYLENSNCEFIIAYPNELALAVINNSFYGFKIASNFSLRIVENLKFISTCIPTNCIKLSSFFLNWKFSRKNYFVILKEEKLFICKKYNNNIDIIEIFNKSDIDLSVYNLPTINPCDSSNYIVPSFRLSDPKIGDLLHQQSIVICKRKSSNLNIERLDFSNLGWDVL